MNTTQQKLDHLAARPKLRLAEIERILRKLRVIVPAPSRRTLTRMCEEGVLEWAPRRNARSPYLVYEDSLAAWIRSLDGIKIECIPPAIPRNTIESLRYGERRVK